MLFGATAFMFFFVLFRRYILAGLVLIYVFATIMGLFGLIGATVNRATESIGLRPVFNLALRDEVLWRDVHSDDMRVWVRHTAGDRTAVHFSTTIANRTERTIGQVEITCTSYWDISNLSESVQVTLDVPPKTTQVATGRVILPINEQTWRNPYAPHRPICEMSEITEKR